MSLDKHLYALLEAEQDKLKLQAQWQGKIVDEVEFQNCESRTDSEDDDELRLKQYQGKVTPEIGEDCGCGKCGCDEHCTDDDERNTLQQGANVDNDEELKESLIGDIVEGLEDCSEDNLDRIADICGISESYAIKYDLLTKINAGLGGCTISQLKRIAKLVADRDFFDPKQN
jgi:hypothetical protein